jgi:hypothetical protein
MSSFCGFDTWSWSWGHAVFIPNTNSKLVGVVQYEHVIVGQVMTAMLRVNIRMDQLDHAAKYDMNT